MDSRSSRSYTRGTNNWLNGSIFHVDFKKAHLPVCLIFRINFTVLASRKKVLSTFNNDGIFLKKFTSYRKSMVLTNCRKWGTDHSPQISYKSYNTVLSYGFSYGFSYARPIGQSWSSQRFSCSYNRQKGCRYFFILKDVCLLILRRKCWAIEKNARRSRTKNLDRSLTSSDSQAMWSGDMDPFKMSRIGFIFFH